MLCVQRWQQVTQQEVKQVIARVRGRSLRTLALGTVRRGRWLTYKTFTAAIRNTASERRSREKGKSRQVLARASVRPQTTRGVSPGPCAVSFPRLLLAHPALACLWLVHKWAV